MKTKTYQIGLISIIIPVFNHADLVIEMIKSIQANSYTNWELILVDDGSKETEGCQVEEYIKDDKRICYYTRDRMPKGAQTCRNIGLSLAQGEYTCFFDSDDYISHKCLEQRIVAISNHPSLDFMVFPTGLMNKGQLIIRSERQLFGYPIYTDDLECLLKRVLPFIVCSNIYRTQSLIDNKVNWDEKIRSMQDGDFNIQALLLGLKYEYADAQPDYFYRTDASVQSVSKKICSQEHFDSHLYYIQKSYQTVRSYHGNRYDQALYEGVLFLFNLVFYQNLNVELALKLCQVVEANDIKRGRELKRKLRFTLLLSHIMSYHTARRIVMFRFLSLEIRDTRARNRQIKQYQESHHIY